MSSILGKESKYPSFGQRRRQYGSTAPLERPVDHQGRLQVSAIRGYNSTISRNYLTGNLGDCGGGQLETATEVAHSKGVIIVPSRRLISILITGWVCGNDDDRAMHDLCHTTIREEPYTCFLMQPARVRDLRSRTYGLPSKPPFDF